MSVYTVVGLRQIGSNPAREATSLTEAKPTALASDTNGPDVTEEFTIPYGVRVTAVKSFDGASSVGVGALAFMLSLGAYSNAGSGGDLLSGSQSTLATPVSSTLLTDSKSDTLQKISSQLPISNQRPDKTVICLKSDSVNKRAAIVIGDTNNPIGISTVIDNNQELNTLGCPS